MVAFAASVLLHGAALVLLLSRRPLPIPQPPVEVELVQQPAQQQGAQRPAPRPTPAAGPPAPPLPPAPQVPAPSAPSPPITPQAAAPAVNLGDAAREIDPLSVTGDNVVPPAPDARYRNVPPRYPAAAARMGIGGTVHLLVRVSPDGLPLAVLVTGSSGYAVLDAEARRAVLLWRFRPARADGEAVPYDYEFDIHFLDR